MAWTELTASDGHTLKALRLEPEGASRGAVVVAQEIFGINRHIQAVAARYAGLGYTAIAPALFDRLERDVDLGYDEAGVTRGRELAMQLEAPHILADMGAAVASVADAGPVCTVGYCFGGAVVWGAAAHLPGLSCAASYYGSRILRMRDQAPKVPVIMHVGREDASFPIDEVREIAAAHDAVTLHEYDAGHGFNCDHRADFRPQAAAHALSRTLAFFETHAR